MSSACVVIYHPHYIGNHEQSWCNLYKAGHKEISFEPLINIGCHRYSSALPSMKRVPQYRADIIAVLLVTFEVSIVTFKIIIIWSYNHHLWRYHDHNPNYDQHNLSFFSWCSPVLILFMSFCTLWQRIRWKYLQIYKQIWQRTRWNYFQIFTNTCRSAQGENIFKYSQIFTNTFGSAQGGKKLQFYKIYTNMAAHKVKIFTNIQNLSSLFWNLIDIHYQNVQMSKVPFF